MRIIAFGHLSRSGKSSAQKLLVSHLRTNGSGIDAAKGSIAAQIKQECYEKYGHYGLQVASFYEVPSNEYLRDVKLEGINLTPVELWVQYGLDAERESPAGLLKNMLDNTPTCDLLVIADLRRWSECALIHSLKGFVVRVDRPIAEVKSSIDLELLDYAMWHYILKNDHDLKHLNRQLVQMTTDLGIDKRENLLG